MKRNPLVDTLLAMPTPDRLAALRALSDEERHEIRHHWPAWARDEQLPPAGDDWRLWLILAGRGFGKTRAGSEWIRHVAQRTPDARIALVAATLGEARAVMVEGESGLIDSAPPGRLPQFEPSLRRLTWPNGAQATLYSAGEPESLRGPQHSHACRPGAEGNIGQRSAVPPRCPCLSGRRRRARRAAACSTRRAGLAHFRIAIGRMDRPGWKHCCAARRKLAVHRSAVWHAGV